MALKKLVFKPGINQEGTRYSTEGGWYECDKIRFRQGLPETIGGWARANNNTFLGFCRSLWTWTTLANATLTGVGTNLKFYIEQGGLYRDVTPIRETDTLTDPFETTSGSSIVTVNDVAGGFIDGDFVTFSGATAVGGLTLNGEYQITFVSVDEYTIDAGTPASSTATGGGTVTAAYQINVGPAEITPFAGWGAGGFGNGPWGEGAVTADVLRLWSQSNFGEDLIFGPVGGGIYYWDASSGLSTRAVALSTLSGASDAPVIQNTLLVSDVSRFVFCFGVNELGSTDLDPMLIRWSDQEDAADWTPSSLNQAGGIRLSRGSKIVAALQARQEILVWTDTALYSLQYVGAPVVWSTQLVGENISIASKNSVSYINGVAYWMGRDKFYMYDGAVRTLPCDLRKTVFSTLCYLNYPQVFSGTIDRFHEIWWFYCAKGDSRIGYYVVYNYLEQVWYNGTMARTAWLDSGLTNYPIAASYNNTLLNQEIGIDDNETGIPAGINAYIQSSEIDIEDGDRFSFVRKFYPDMKFTGSTAASPKATLSVLGLSSSGSGYNDPESVGGDNELDITRGATSPIEAYTDQLNIRVRGRQLVIRIESDQQGVAWKFGTPRIDIRPDGRRS
ncbi:MAG: hypothetical protein RLZZ602_1586 [Pseudomonadota bacterium]|jgi:hypothetical protein